MYPQFSPTHMAFGTLLGLICIYIYINIHVYIYTYMCMYSFVFRSG